MSKALVEYIKTGLENLSMSGRAAAEAMGISQSYFVRVTTGKVEKPGLEFCSKLAALFDDSPTKVMRLAGLLPELDTDEALIEEIRELSEKDPRFEEILRTYQDLPTDEAKDAFLAMARVALEAYDGTRSEEEE